MLVTGTEKQPKLTTALVERTSSSTFPGFKAPTSNTTFTPNQFFDVVIPNFSRGVVRIVGYLLRRTLGWCDANGNPQEEQISSTYSDLERRAGVSRDMIRHALDDAVAGKIIECVTEGRPKLAHDAGQTATYQLRWSAADYTTRREAFTGFFEGEGNRTDIPNEFFDVVIPNEPLSVIKVVGSIIRHSIGFQARHGRRRQQIAISYQQIENYARFGSRSDLAKALRIALEKNYIVRIEDGVFSPDAAERRRATYAIRWCDYPIGQKFAPADQSENRTIIGQISAPADRSENRTSIKTKQENETVKQPQPSSFTEAFTKLVEVGFDNSIANQLATQHSLQEIESQIAWLSQRAPARSKLGMLRRAIEGKWPEPAKLRATEVADERGREFARHFFAAFGGNKGEPVAEPSTLDAELAASFVARLTQITPANDIAAWGRELASRALDQRSPIPSLALAIRQCGDAMLASLQTRVRAESERKLEHAKSSHYAQYLPVYQQWLKHRETELRQTNASEFFEFEAKREASRKRLTDANASWSKSMLAVFDQENTRLADLRSHFSLPDFWQWDATINNEPFKPRT